MDRLKAPPANLKTSLGILLAMLLSLLPILTTAEELTGVASIIDGDTRGDPRQAHPPAWHRYAGEPSDLSG
jgi:hypothetical protein